MGVPSKLIQNAAVAALAAAVIVGSPTAAFAKGGGHGGGSHTSMSRSYSGSSSRSSSSSSRSSSSSSYTRSPSRSSSSSSYTHSPSSYTRSPSRSSSSRGSSRRGSSRTSSSSSGRTGGRVVRPPPSPPTVYHQPSPPVVYAPSPPAVYRSSPSVVIRDEPAVVYRTATDTAYLNGLWTGRIEAATFAAMASYAYTEVTKRLDEDREDDADATEAVDFARELAETRELMRELKAEHAQSDSLARAIDKPLDGKYSGESAEDDAGDQEVRTTLTFRRDGSIAGDGFDGVDGAYAIKEGRWSQKRVAWIEAYDQGFTVALRGQVRPDGTIVALWASSRGVGGSVSLEAPSEPSLRPPFY